MLVIYLANHMKIFYKNCQKADFIDFTVVVF